MSELHRLPEIRVRLEPVRPGQRAISLDYPDNLGARTKLGGEPTWIQGDQTPECPSCEELMTFVAQIDSIDHASWHNYSGRESLSDSEYMFGDVGMIYVFFCFDCGQPGCAYQCY